MIIRGEIMNELQKVLKKVRIDYNESLRDMAKKLGISASYLSAIEVGKRRITQKIINKLKENYEMTTEYLDILNNFKLSKIEKLEKENAKLKDIIYELDKVERYKKAIECECKDWHLSVCNFEFFNDSEVK